MRFEPCFRVGLLLGAALSVTSCASMRAVPQLTSMTGQVIDAHGAPIVGARVALVTGQRVPVGSGTTDAAGRYSFDLGPHPRESLILKAEGEGFERWSGWVGWDRLDGLTILLDRKVDSAYLEALRGVSNAPDRVWRIDEILAVDDTNFSIEALFPYLGELREDLRAASQRSTRTLDHGDLLAERALKLLAFWGDPADRALFDPWLAENPWLRSPPEEVEVPDPGAMCRAWAEVHFRHEGAGFRAPRYFCTEPVIDPAGLRVLMLFDVTSGLYHYNMHLVFERKSTSEPWRLRSVIEGITDEPPL
ncbi:MAG TPA: carboxypeptidase regulatory-like domain-containing protein [Thermoanaerobaculia bacterium]|nr:carboxypeptidase regulatory-like domain-containing protein [Thermoanaerobaculia bacterium]